MTSSIYIVDDDEAVRDSLTSLLEAFGYRVETFAGGAEFLHRLAGAIPGCVILDINMPQMSGPEVLKAVRANWPWLPVILITGRAENFARADANSVQGLLEKPFSAGALVRTIEQAMVPAA